MSRAKRAKQAYRKSYRSGGSFHDRSVAAQEAANRLPRRLPRLFDAQLSYHRNMMNDDLRRSEGDKGDMKRFEDDFGKELILWLLVQPYINAPVCPLCNDGFRLNVGWYHFQDVHQLSPIETLQNIIHFWREILQQMPDGLVPGFPKLEDLLVELDRRAEARAGALNDHPR